VRRNPRRGGNMDEGNHILACRHEGVCYIAVHGRATAHHCTALRDFVFRSLRDGARRVQVDLGACHYGDSTFLGTLLQFRKECSAFGADALKLAAPTPEFEATLRSMGLRRLFDCGPADVPPGLPWATLPTEVSGRCSFDFQHNVAVAHRMLVDSSDVCRERYSVIADTAEQELVRRKAATAQPASLTE
jgi:anti-anti-sigma factor